MLKIATRLLPCGSSLNMEPKECFLRVAWPIRACDPACITRIVLECMSRQIAYDPPFKILTGMQNRIYLGGPYRKAREEPLGPH